jgi:hypothetical protein
VRKSRILDCLTGEIVRRDYWTKTDGLPATLVSTAGA